MIDAMKLMSFLAVILVAAPVAAAELNPTMEETRAAIQALQKQLAEKRNEVNALQQRIGTETKDVESLQKQLEASQKEKENLFKRLEGEEKKLMEAYKQQAESLRASTARLLSGDVYQMKVDGVQYSMLLHIPGGMATPLVKGSDRPGTQPSPDGKPDSANPNISRVPPRVEYVPVK